MNTSGKKNKQKGETAVKIVVEEKKLVMGLYFITLLSSMLAIVDNVPLIGVLLKVKYLYAIAIIFFCLYDGLIIWNRRFYFAVGLLVIHTILYGLVFVNWIIADATRVHFEQMITLYVMTIFTALYVYKKKCYLEWLEMSCLALGIMLLWSAFTHPGNFVNPIYFVNIFSRMERYRAPFGMGDVNFCGNYCLYMIIMSVFLWNEWKKQEKKVDIKIRAAVIFTDCVAMYMLLSTASRSAIISLALFFGMAALLKYRGVLLRHWKLIAGTVGVVAVLAVLVMASTGMLSDIWSQSNREGNISINLPYFIYHSNYINGMGYMDNSGFLNMAYGYATTAMDIYYLYIFFGTGILGSVLIFGQMIYLLYCLIRYSKTEGRDLALSLFLMMLFYAVWQVNYMNYRYWTGMLHMVILFLFLLRVREEKNTYHIQLKRR